MYQIRPHVTSTFWLGYSLARLLPSRACLRFTEYFSARHNGFFYSTNRIRRTAQVQKSGKEKQIAEANGIEQELIDAKKAETKKEAKPGAKKRWQRTNAERKKARQQLRVFL